MNDTNLTSPPIVVSIEEKRRLKAKRKMERIKSDPIRYERYLERYRNYARNKRIKMLNNPDTKEPYLKKKRISSLNHYHTEILTDVDKLNQLKEYRKQYRLKIKSDPILHQKKKEQYKKSWKKVGYDRMRRQVFRRLARHSNRNYKNVNLIAPIDLWRVAKKQRLICPFTGQKLTIDNMSIDHIIPKSKGGLNVPSNVRLTLKSVNMARQSMTDDEFLSLCQSIVQNYKKQSYSSIWGLDK